MILFLGRYLIGVLECHQLTPPNKFFLFLAKYLPPIYHHHHYLHCTISLIMKKNSEPTSSKSHLTRNEKWKLWVGWHGSFYWLLCLCVLYFVFCAVSKTIQCSQVSPISILKNENYELCILAGFFITTEKKKVPVVCLAGVSVFGSGGKLAIFFCGGKFSLRPEK